MKKIPFRKRVSELTYSRSEAYRQLSRPKMKNDASTIIQVNMESRIRKQLNSRRQRIKQKMRSALSKF